MPSRPPRLCTQPGCSALTSGGKCERCAQRYEDRRGSAAKRGYDRKWRKRRKRILARDPICRICELSPTTDVDHIVPRARGGSDDDSNLQGTCHECHSRKTALEDGGFGR